MDSRWKNLYTIGGISAFVIALLLIGEIMVYSVIPVPKTTMEYLEVFIDSPIFGLLHFDLLGMVSYILFIPVILSLYMIMRKNNESLMLISTIIGISVFFGTNTGFSMLSISKQYIIAQTETEKAMLLSSFHAMLTLFKVQAFMLSYIIVSTAWVMIASVMLRSEFFNRFTAYIGIIAGLAGIIAEILENTSMKLVNIAIGFYFAAIVCLFIWIILTAKKLLYIGRKSTKA